MSRSAYALSIAGMQGWHTARHSAAVFFVCAQDVLNVIEKERPEGVIVQFGGQTPLSIAKPLAEALAKNPIPAASGAPPTLQVHCCHYTSSTLQSIRTSGWIATIARQKTGDPAPCQISCCALWRF